MKKTQKDTPWENRTFRLQVGMVVALTFCLVAFEWKSYGETPLEMLAFEPAEAEEVLDIPITDQKKQPPKVVAPIIKEVTDEDPVEEPKIELIFEEPDPGTPIVQPEPQEPEVEEIPDEPFLIVEKNAVPKEGMAAFYKFLGKKMRYPKQAKRMGIQGKVYIQFVIEKNGKLSDIRAIKGIGGGCDEEAVRVIGLSPAWEAGRQRGRAVRQRMVIPLTFKLN